MANAEPSEDSKRNGSTFAGLNRAANAAGRTAEREGRRAIGHVSDTLRRLGAARSLLTRERVQTKPGAAPGLTVEQLAQLPPGEVETRVRCLDFGPDALEEHDDPDLDTLLQHGPRDGTAVRWIDVQGLGNRQRLATLARRLRIHPLVLEDVLNLQHRPKIEPVPAEESEDQSDAAESAAGEAGQAGEKDQADERGDPPLEQFLIVRMIHEREDRLVSEQVSLLVGPGLVVSLQQAPGDPWDPIRRRLENPASLLRRHDASFLVYALLDAIVDFYFPAVERYARLLDALEAEVFHGRGGGVLESIHGMRHELMLLRHDLQPIRDVITALRRGDVGPIHEDTRLYLGDAHDHAVQALELIETYRDRAAGLADTHMTVVSNRMNEVMKVLTIMGSIFLPLSFFAGVFGMNFEHFPGLGYRNAFWWFCGGCAAVALGMLAWFRHKRWL